MKPAFKSDVSSWFLLCYMENDWVYMVRPLLLCTGEEGKESGSVNTSLRLAPAALLKKYLDKFAKLPTNDEDKQVETYTLAQLYRGSRLTHVASDYVELNCFIWLYNSFERKNIQNIIWGPQTEPCGTPLCVNFWCLDLRTFYKRRSNRNRKILYSSPSGGNSNLSSSSKKL